MSNWIARGLAVALCLGMGSTADAQSLLGRERSEASEPAPLSTECHARRPTFETWNGLGRFRHALRRDGSATVLAIGSSSIAGIGASSEAMNFPSRLEDFLRAAYPGAWVRVVPKGISGELAPSTAERLRNEVETLRPDLVVWQVGTNDGLRRADLAAFKALVLSTLAWLEARGTEVVLVDPQYVDRWARDAHFMTFVAALEEIARARGIALVHRFSAMEDISRRPDAPSMLAADGFHLNDLGYRCMAEYTSRAIESGVTRSERAFEMQRKLVAGLPASF